MPLRGNRSLAVAGLARTDEKGTMRVRVNRGVVTGLRLEIYEPPKSFEEFLSGRTHLESPDIAARICGLCPVSYQVAACRAIEDACGIDVGERIGLLRRLLSCGEWIANNALYIYLVRASDLLGYDGVVELARDHRDLVERGLSIKKAGTAIVDAIGGRQTHPVDVRVGGFRAVPGPATLRDLATRTLRPALDDALSTVDWVAGLDFPDFRNEHELLALTDGDRYPIDRGVPRSSRGLSFPTRQFEKYVVEERIGGSVTRRATLAGRGRYLTGPVARYALNSHLLSPLAAQAATAAKLQETFHNPFRAIVIRAVETVYALEHALDLIEEYEPPAAPFVDVPPRRAVGFHAVESPRGLLFQRYQLAEDGTIVSARILPPIVQNQASIEDDLRRVVQERLGLDDKRLAEECERALRNYDPCTSCSTSLLDLTVIRS